MRSVMATIVASACMCGAAHAEPIDDARAIVELTVDESQFELIFDAMGDLMLSALQNELANSGKAISEDAAKVYVALLTKHMASGLSGKMQEPLAEAYALNLSPDTLAAYRAFLETDAGREVAATQSLILQESTKIGEELAPPVATDAIIATMEDMKAGNWPEGTLKTTQKELWDLLELPPISEEPPAR